MVRIIQPLSTRDESSLKDDRELDPTDGLALGRLTSWLPLQLVVGGARGAWRRPRPAPTCTPSARFTISSTASSSYDSGDKRFHWSSRATSSNILLRYVQVAVSNITRFRGVVKRRKVTLFHKYRAQTIFDPVRRGLHNAKRDAAEPAGVVPYLT
ncbi:hypothetical protein EVAR_55871_1 [Eumeta japonica]|uniref:Uncharacterized protein n=1 Tax=Eumeta variegata TaxID=151549 RepID=A0A4C1YMQ0_EUMVA|nr:hypothetical protein EVAR_55871_1 [Eumeta japonica]